MDPDQARYYAMILRAMADLLAAGEPVCWSWSYASVPGEPTTVAISIEGERFMAARVAVNQRVDAGDPDYAIRVEYREPSRRPSGPRRRRR
jgi:hypothetical protein